MAVLVEALTMVVPRIYLDVAFPGGVDGFMAAHPADGERIRFTVADEALVAVSSLERSVMTACRRTLMDLGAVVVDTHTNHFVDLAFVDQLEGVTMPCTWLEWSRTPEGVAHVRALPAGSHEVVTPPGWTPESSTSLWRVDMRSEPGRMLKLAEKEGIEYWLDFETGRQLAGLASPIKPLE